MLVGYKYCGGCNPYYDRAAAMAHIKDAFKEIALFEHAQEGKTYDAGIMISGCVRRCSASGLIATKYGVEYLAREDGLKGIKRFLLDVYDKVNGGKREKPPVE